MLICVIFCEFASFDTEIIQLELGRMVIIMTGYLAFLTMQERSMAKRLSSFLDIPLEDLIPVPAVFGNRRTFAGGSQLISRASNVSSAYVLVSGWAFSFRKLPDGSRQITDIRIPGDFIGLRSVLLRNCDNRVEAILQTQAVELLQQELLDLFQHSPRLGMCLLGAASKDAAMSAEHCARMGRRTSTERMAHFLLEMNVRLRRVGMADLNGYRCPLSQYVLADFLGLSPVHVNRVLRDLRELGLVTFQHGRVTFNDYRGLVEFVDFDGTYLQQVAPVAISEIRKIH